MRISSIITGMRKRFVPLLISCVLVGSVYAETPFQGHAELNNEYNLNDETLFTGKTEYLEKKDELIEELDNKNSERDIIDNKIKDKEKENGILKCADLYKRYTELSEELLSVETRLKLLKKDK